MTTRARRVGTRWAALAAGLALAVTACSDDANDGSSPDETSSSSGKDAPPAVATLTTVEGVSGRLHKEQRLRVKDAVNEVIDQWFDGAYIGDFPRSDYATAFAGFTDGAQANAMDDLDLLSNKAIADRIDNATAINRRVRLDLLAPGGRPRAATARFVLDFRIDGELEGPRRVTGSLYLTKQLGEWHVFGYDVLEAVAR